jgi:transcriptional regulator with XRE-family HTH domain
MVREDRLREALTQARQRRRLPDPAARRSLRERAGISQGALADAVGVSSGAVSRWESGERAPSGERLEAYLTALDRLARETLA